MNGPRQHLRIFIVTGLVVCLGLALDSAVAQQLPSAVLIRMGRGEKPEVVPIYGQQPQVGPGGGLLVWNERGRESWRVYPSTASPTRTPQASNTLAMGSRVGGPGWGTPGGTGPAANLLTVQLDQLIGQVVFRGEGFLTPSHGAYHLNPRITIRRQPHDGDVKYPAATLQIKQGGNRLVEIPVKPGQTKIAWSEIPELPDRFQAGLPPGEYTLLEEGGSRGTTFFVEDTAIRDWVMETPGELERLLGTREHRLYLQVAAGHFLAQVDEDDRPRPYAADALDVLEAAPAESLTPYLNQLRDDVVARLEGGQSSQPDTSDDDATGIPQIDAARQQILVADWDAALRLLDSPELAETERSRALATLYRAVILAESGQATEGAARAMFCQAIDQLEEHPADVYRARNNYGGALLVRAQDRLYNHAFQIASGVPYPLICALMDWRESLYHYESARALAERLGPDDRTAVEANIARLYALLADVIRTLDPPVAGRRGFPQGDIAAANYARQLASAVLAAKADESDDVVRAASHEILAQLAFRNGDAETCRAEAQQAIDAYLRAGALAGVESGHRMLGLSHLRQAETSEEPAAGAVRGSGGAVRGSDGAVRGSDGAVRGSDGAVRGSDGAVRGSDGAVRGSPDPAPLAARSGDLRRARDDLRRARDQASETRQRALRHLLLSHTLSELLRDQIPADHIGLSRAGFFARRAYVNEQICKLFVAEKRPADALRYAELAKARALQDVLAVGAGRPTGRAIEPRELPEILADWPEDVAALEYFLGTEEVWLFLVDTSGKVSSRVLQDGRGRPLASRDLVARVHSFLSRIDHQADQMRQRLDAGMGYDHTWQYELHDFQRQLLPKGVLKKLRKAETVLIVPHHILHYFPLVALVTQPDTSPLTAQQMAKPRFLLDEPFHLDYVPSLAAWDLLREEPDRPIRQVSASGIVQFQTAQALPGVEKDLENLKATFGEMVRTVLSDEEATEARAKAVFNQAGLLFLATHGKNFADQPLSSYLMFRPDAANDGYLTAGEIYSTDVAADLVVMSACYSGLADRSPLPGDDLFGLQRALLHAGARSVVSGMWDVYDGTGPELMRSFFEELVEGKRVPAALANSQRALLNRLRASQQVEPWLHPYFWAVYTAVGDDRTRVEMKTP